MTWLRTPSCISIVPVIDAELDDYAPIGEQVIKGDLRMRAKVLWTAADGMSATGIWQCPPVKLRLEHPFDETFVVLSGRLTVTPECGKSQDMGPGDLIVIQHEAVNVWDIHETVTKVFAVHQAQRPIR